ncbi:adenylate/guanylate cyclase domain-containing protein [Neolewinella litorea]|uniref:Adenylate/guanylate cyclase domain-containing protein n=1 Tax=Neolewinella litorea TaxID=2562452 RepID=A0A4S4NAU0_9BACT|nr:adenylate/guanylate cyclase domain-containing protein [Neolewinella litorea]THH36476.1 adenylate/guanylate cyclase domain-containing protein [Neolewinella litorea]
MAIYGRHKLIFWFQMVVTWTVAVSVFGFVRHYGWPARMGFSPEYLIEPWFDLSLGVILGTGYFLIERGMNRQIFQRLSFLHWAALKSTLNLLLMLLLIAVAIVLYPYLNRSVAEDVTFREFLFSKLMFLVLGYFILVSLLITLFQRMHQKLGPGILGNMLLGRYHHPREEERIFLFVDMQSSTTIAEQLGHVAFSRLIQDCFADLTDTVVRHRAEIYQYVGDEVILCWKLPNGIRNNNCVAAYFQFVETLASRADYYDRTYGLQPVFKAGGHLGRTTVAEVGVLKRELAYHGDVLNTTARIQGKCNELEERLLISPALAGQLKLSQHYLLREHPPVELAGKRESLTVIGVQRPTPALASGAEVHPVG